MLQGRPGAEGKRCGHEPSQAAGFTPMTKLVTDTGWGPLVELRRWDAPSDSTFRLHTDVASARWA